jgi:toxin ParE1/3/4
MKLRFTPRAIADLTEIAEYIRERNPKASQAVREAILSSLRTLALFPDIGRRQTIEGVRKLVVRRYRYLAYYTVDHAHDEIAILTIRHPARRREYSDL